MNVHNMLYLKCLDGTAGVSEVLTAYDKGLIDHDSVAILTSVTPECSVDTLISNRINEFNYFCENNIEKGIDVKLSDGTVEHFSLSTKDQLNIMRNITNAVMGMDNIEYHADDGPQKVYTVEDMNRIYSTMQAKINSETTYRNNLREWIRKLDDFDAICKIRYGDEIPEEHWTDGWRSIQNRIAKAVEEKNNPAPEAEPTALSDEPTNGGIVSKVVSAVTGKKKRAKKTETETQQSSEA